MTMRAGFRKSLDALFGKTWTAVWQEMTVQLPNNRHREQGASQVDEKRLRRAT
jgi:hypothetical protein